MNLSSSIALGMEVMTPLSSSIVVNKGEDMTVKKPGPPYLPGRKPAHLLSPIEPYHRGINHDVHSGY
jgi:hypothetical protein